MNLLAITNSFSNSLPDLSWLNLDNSYVQHTLFAFTAFALGVLGMVLGQRVVSNGKVCISIGLGVGLGTMHLVSTDYAFLAPGCCGVFITSFLASNVLLRFCNAASQNKG